MAYCQYCGSDLGNAANFCPNCGAALNNTAAQNNGSTTQWSDTAKTVGTVAGVAVGASLLSRMFRRPRYRHGPPMGPFHGPGPHHRGPGGPMGGHGPMGGRGPGGPGGRR